MTFYCGSSVLSTGIKLCPPPFMALTELRSTVPRHPLVTSAPLLKRRLKMRGAWHQQRAPAVVVNAVAASPNHRHRPLEVILSAGWHSSPQTAGLQLQLQQQCLVGVARKVMSRLTCLHSSTYRPLTVAELWSGSSLSLRAQKRERRSFV